MLPLLKVLGLFGALVGGGLIYALGALAATAPGLRRRLRRQLSASDRPCGPTLFLLSYAAR